MKPNPKRQLKSYVATNIKADETARTVTAKVSVEVCDRDGEVIRVDGINQKSYLQNPLLLWQHNYDEPPIGKCIELKRTQDALVATFEFAPRPATHPPEAAWFADEVFHLFQVGALRAFSIGFQVNDWRNPTASDQRRWGDELVRVLNKTTLLEISAVVIPANPEAVAIAVSKGYVSRSTAKAIGVDVPETVCPPTNQPAPEPTTVRCIECERMFPADKLADVPGRGPMCETCRTLTAMQDEPEPAKTIVRELASEPEPRVVHVLRTIGAPPMRKMCEREKAILVECLASNEIAKRRGALYGLGNNEYRAKCLAAGIKPTRSFGGTAEPSALEPATPGGPMPEKKVVKDVTRDSAGLIRRVVETTYTR